MARLRRRASRAGVVKGMIDPHADAAGRPCGCLPGNPKRLLRREAAARPDCHLPL